MAKSNNNPFFIAYHYLSIVEELQGENLNKLYIARSYVNCVLHFLGTPSLLHCDLGSENSHLAFLQPFLRHNCLDCYAGEHSFRYGRSVSNQVAIACDFAEK